MNPGYYRHPTIASDRLVLVCEDDLWSVSPGGVVPRRLTAGINLLATHPRQRPDLSQRPRLAPPKLPPRA